MERLHVNDIETLDIILKKVTEKSIVRVSDLPALFNRDFTDELNDVKLNHYKRYFEIIQEWNIADVYMDDFNYYIKAKDIDTERFYEDGGFAKKYEDQQNEIDSKEIARRKTIDDAKISSWTRKTYWWTFGIAIIGLIIAIWAFVRTFQ
jgi:hypothetical protein